MIRFVFRFFGVLCLAAAFIFAVYDGMKSIVDQTVFLTTTGDMWTSVHAASQPRFQAWLTEKGIPWAWDPVTLEVMRAPFWALLIVIGALFILMGRRRRPLIGYARS